MKLTSDLFSKYKNLEPKDRAVKKAVTEAIKEVLGRDVDGTCVAVRGNVAHVSASALLKQEIRLKHGAVLFATNKRVAPKRLEKIL